MSEPVFTIKDLIFLMQRLRDPQRGCPWDLKQTYQSIVPSTLEEVYEVVEAIENNDRDNLREELGDLLFHVVFYSQMASEADEFDFDDVAHGIVAKLVRRHPHVFPSGQLYEDGLIQPLSDQELHAQWERIKQQEKKLSGKEHSDHVSLLGDVPKAIPALQRAYKIQKKLATVNFDWKQTEELFPVVLQEIQETQEALRTGTAAEVEEELGDVLFAVVNLCRHLKVDPETALRHANRKVEQRFAFVEAGLAVQGKKAEQASMEEMESLWQEAKRKLNSETSSE